MNFDKNKYANLLVDALPGVIESEEDYQRTLEIINKLMTRDEASLSPEEDRLLGLLGSLVVDYEKKILPPLEKQPPLEILKFLMEQNDLRQKDLLDVFGSDGTASEVLNGKRGISKNQAKKLAEKFNVSVALFIG